MKHKTHGLMVAVLLLAGCEAVSDLVGPSCDGIAGLSVVRTVEHPGSGREVTVRLRTGDGTPPGDNDRAGCLSARGVPGGTSAAARRIEDSYTLLLVDPGAGMADNDRARALVAALIARRPARDRMAVYRWAGSATQVVPFTKDRALIEERVAMGLPPAKEPLASSAEVLEALAPVAARVAGPATDALRTIVLVSPRPAPAIPAAALGAAEPNLVVWLGNAGEEGPVALPAGLRFGAAPGQDPATAAAALWSRLDAYKARGHYALGLCASPAAQTVGVAVNGAEAQVPLAASLEETRGAACRPGPIAHGERAFPKKLELIFTEEEKLAAELAYADRANKPSFPLTIRVAPGAKPTPATAHFRGESSYGCPRRNYSFNLEGKSPRFIFPGSAAQKFHLVAMCLDRLYLRNFTALTLMAEEGLFPIPFEMVELVVDGATQGPYILVENITDSLRERTSRPTSVMRRYSAPGGMGTLVELRWSGTTDEQALMSYAGVLGGTQGLAGAGLETAVRTRWALDGYFRWIALMNAMGSGDYVDELFVYASESTGPDGKPVDLFQFAGWDQDDLFSACHYNGRFTIVDPNGLIHCTEAELDKRLLVDPVLYGRYTDTMAKLLERLTPERFERTLRSTAERVLGYLRSSAVRKNLPELRRLNPDAADSYEIARTLVESDLELLTVQFGQNRSTLLARLAQVRAGK